MYLEGTEIDKKVGWPLGRAESLARRNKLPHYRLPDGAIRFKWAAVSKLIQSVRVVAANQGGCSET
jgi:hypothetical protein